MFVVNEHGPPWEICVTPTCAEGMEPLTSPLLRLVRRCVVRKADGPWRELLDAFDELIERGIRSHGDGADTDEFKQWFPGWLFPSRKLEAAHRKTEQKTNSGELSTPIAQEEFLRSYLARVILSGVAEFYNERRTRLRIVEPAQLERFASPAMTMSDLEEQLRGELLKLPEDQRVPFRLKFFKYFGPLPPDEIQYIADRSQLAPEQVAQCVEDEFRRNVDRKFPLSSAFIGELLGIAVADDGRNTTVDQRISRARVSLSTALGLDR